MARARAPSQARFGLDRAVVAFSYRVSGASEEMNHEGFRLLRDLTNPMC
jgi:hypothetical protein